METRNSELDTRNAGPTPARRSRNPLRRLYYWVVAWADRPAGPRALFWLAFAESSFFPVPPDFLLIPLCLGRRRGCWWFATICTVGSVLGGIAGYAIGYGFWAQTSGFWIGYVFSEKTFLDVQAVYRDYDVAAVFAAGFTPIPYKVFTIAAGVCEIAFWPFVAASVVGRGARFFLVAALLHRFGDAAKAFIDRHFGWLTFAAAALGIGGFLSLKYLL